MVILESKKIKSVSVSIVSPSSCHEAMGHRGKVAGKLTQMEESLDWLWREGNDCVPLFSRAIRNVSSYLIYLYVDLVRHIHKLKISICHRILRKEEGTRL